MDPIRITPQGLDPEQVAELEALESLLTSPGWALLTRKADEQWGDRAFALRVENAVGESTTEGVAQERCTALVTARRHVRALVAWPAERLRALASARQQADAPQNPFGRRR